MFQMHRVIKENIFINAFKHPKCEGNKLTLRKKWLMLKTKSSGTEYIYNETTFAYHYCIY